MGACPVMSWDLYVMDLPVDAQDISDIPHDFVGEPLGTRTDLIAMIHEVVPEAEFFDPSWGHISHPDFSIEISMGREELDSFAFHVRGGDLAIGLVAEILQKLNLRAVDPQADSGLFTPASAQASFQAWRAYRDSVIPGPSGQ